MTYQSPYVAKILRSGKLLFSAPNHNQNEGSSGWYSHDDGSDRDCAIVMDNETFLRMLRNGEVEFVKTPTPENQLSLSI